MRSEKRLNSRPSRKSGLAKLPRRVAEGFAQRRAVLFDQDGRQCHRLHKILLGLRRFRLAMRARVEFVPNHARHFRQYDGNAMPAGEHCGRGAIFEQIVIEWDRLRMPAELWYGDDFTQHRTGGEDVNAQALGAWQLHRRRWFLTRHARDTGKWELGRLHAG